ncbi:MAG: translation initiation factor IF-2 [Deferribacteraceae bacterium]|jgi:translation initiation factor IF-2|nr:translation initiation factor IF-2 [Deferribacteraceae bacterium]
MADFKLTDVAKKAEISAEEALQKLLNAGEAVADINSAISAEQMRILGVDPQQMLNRRKERLRQALERHHGSMGKEIVMSSRNKEEATVTPSRKISKEELQKRKSELNKYVQKVDEARLSVSHHKEEPHEPVLEVKAEIQEQPAVFTDPEEPVETPQEIQETAEVVSPEQNIPKPPKQKAPKSETTKKQSVLKTDETPKTEEPSAPRQPTPRPLGPAGYVPDEQKTGGFRRQNSPNYRQKPAGSQSYQRPAGPAATQRPDYKRPAGPAANYRHSSGGRPNTPRLQDDRRPAGGTRTASQGSGFGGAARSEQTQLPEDERRIRDNKKTREVPVTAKEEVKKAKTKTDAKKAKDWTKTITEGISELDIEHEIETTETPVEKENTPVQEVPAPRQFYHGKTDHRRSRRKTDREAVPLTPKPTNITIGEQIVVSELAGIIGIKAAELVKKLFVMGIIATVNQTIDADSAALLCIDYGVDVNKKIVTENDLLPVYEEDENKMQRRPPVVTVMGHVDHGKTSLLDAIRSASVAEKESGGITQHIGAYEVDLNGKKITFLDTPGHEAFTTLRARGAQVTDIVILVVAANDGVMPQTKEAIDHAKAAGVRIVVAVNKIDRPDANPENVRRQLAEYGIISDDWGGEYQFQEISAKKRIGIEDLLERVLLEADVLELRGDPDRPAEGIVIESLLDKQKGPVATVLVKKGTLHRGDTFVVGSQAGKVRAMYNFLGAVIKDATISMPVEVMGFPNVPEAGDTLMVVEDEKVAKNIADMRLTKERITRHDAGGAVSLSDFFNKVKEGQIKELNIIIKTDVQGSLEALRSSLQKLSNVEVKVNVVHDATGGITESDIVLAMASKAIIIGFNVRPDTKARLMAEREGISIELYSIIYKVIEDVKLAIEGLLAPEIRESVIGRVEIRQVFSIPKIGKIAGSYVLEGKVTRGSQIRLIRDNVVVYDGKLASLKRFTDDVKEVTHGYECGLSIDRYQDIKESDILEIYEISHEKRTLEDIRPQDT